MLLKNEIFVSVCFYYLKEYPIDIFKDSLRLLYNTMIYILIYSYKQ